MKSLLLTLVCILNFNVNALDVFGLPGKSCEFFEENIEIKDENTTNGKVIFTLDGNSTVSCNEDTFELESVFLTVYDAPAISRASQDFTGLNLFDIRKYKLLKIYPNLKKIDDKTYQVLDNNKKITFHFLQGKVLALTVDWSKDYEGIIQSQSRASKQKQLANRLVSLYERSLRDLSGYYSIKRDTVRIDNTKIYNDGCSIEFSGTARKNSKNRRIEFWLEYDFEAGIGWTRPSYTSFKVDSDTPGVYQGMIEDDYQRRLSSLEFSSASDATEAAEIFRSLHKLCR